jgi:hypothetical protein
VGAGKQSAVARRDFSAAILPRLLFRAYDTKNQVWNSIPAETSISAG